MEKIRFKVISTPAEEILHAKEGYLELHEDHLRYFINYCRKAPETDAEQDIYNLVGVAKEKIVAVALYQVVTTSNWIVEVSIAENPINIQFNDYKIARDTFNLVYEWKFGKYENN